MKATARRRRTKRKTETMARPPFDLFPTTPEDEEKCFPTAFKAVGDLLRGRKNVLVLVGAGMSVSVGIPDFRSKGSGLYETLDVHVRITLFLYAQVVKKLCLT